MESFLGRSWPFLIMICLGITTLPLFSEELWERETSAKWTLEDTQKILWQSPWVKRKPYFFYNAPRSRMEVEFFVRIQSAEPVRLALAKFAQFQPERNIRVVGPVDPDETRRRAEEMRFPEELVVAVVGFPPSFHYDLNRYSLRLLQPYTSVQIGKGEEIPLKAFIAPGDSQYGEALYRFPRPTLSARSSTLRFRTALWIPHRVDLEVKFDIDKWKAGSEIIY